MKRTISIPIAVTALLVLAICELSINFPIIPRALAAGQPPIDHNTFWAGTYAWGPGDADPAMATDQMSKVAELVVARAETVFDLVSYLFDGALHEPFQFLSG